MKMKINKIMFVLLTVMLVPALGVTPAVFAADSIKVGEIQTYSKLTNFTFPYRNGWQLALEEINFGVSTQQALYSMAVRIDFPELRYFIVAVILQRETGGNLAELLEELALLMRKKVKFDGKVKALAAEGKLTAAILLIVPFLLALYMELNTPGYLNIFFTHPIGRIMLYGCSALMIAGIVVLKRMIAIKV